MIQTILPTPKKTEVFEGVSVLNHAIFTECEMFTPHLPVFTDATKRIFGLEITIAEGGIRVEYTVDEV